MQFHAAQRAAIFATRKCPWQEMPLQREREREKEEGGVRGTDNVAHRLNYIFISYAPYVCV